MRDLKKIFILYPPISKMERYSSKIGEAGGQQIPLGIYYLSSSLRANGYDTKVIDAEAENLSADDIINLLKEYGSKYVGISSTTVAFHRALDIANKIKATDANITIILGGPHVTSNPAHALSYDVFDYGVLREGEITILELLNSLYESKPVDWVKGIAYKVNNKIVKTQDREYIKNLDILPFPAFDQIRDIAIYTPPPSNCKDLPVVSMITSRGCPNKCTFCDRNIFGTTYRERTAGNIYDELKLLKQRYDFKEISFVDDTFLINKKRLYELFRLLDDDKIYFHWTCASRINNVDYDFLKYLKNKGCWHISFGIESGDEAILKIIKKNISLSKVREVIGWCRKLGIKTKGFFIIGHPTETIATIDKTIKMACSLPLDDVVATINTPIPGSPQYAEISKYGTLDETDWSQFNYWRPVFVPHGLTQEILKAKHKKFYREFYIRPRQLLRYFLGFFGKGGLKRFVSLMKASKFLISSSRQ